MVCGEVNSEDIYRRYFFESPDIKIVFNSNSGAIIDINRSAIDYYGYTIDEFRHMTIFDINLFDQEFIVQCITEINVLRNKTFLFKHKLKNGEIREVQALSGGIIFKDELHIISTIVDVTDKLEAERKLKERLERMEMVFAATRAGVWDYDPVHNSVYVDKQWKAILGYEEHELTGGVEEWHSRVHPEDIERVINTMRLCEDRISDQCEIEHRLMHKDGKYRWVSATGKILYNEKKEPMRALGTIIDIQRLKEAEERIKESENILKDFTKAIPDVSAILDEDGRYIEVFGDNNLFLNSKYNLTGSTLKQLFPQELADSMLQDIKQALLTGEPRTLIRELDLGPTKRYFESRLAPMRYRVNGKRMVAIVVSDITERLEVDQMLKFAYELQRKSNFINDVLSGNVILNQRTVAKAKDFGIDFSMSQFCCLIRIEDKADLGEHEKADSQFRKPLDIKSRIIYSLSSKTNYLIWNNKDNIGVFCEPKDPNGSWEQCMVVASEIRTIITETNPDLFFSIGISDIHIGTGSFEKGYQEAWNSLLSAQCQDHMKVRISHFRELGLLQILGSVYGKDYTLEFVSRMVGPLIEYDAERGTDLLLTLEEILKSNNFKETSNKLFIHLKTLTFRKQRIEKILGVSLDSFDTRLALGTAIKLHKLNLGQY